MVSGQLYCCLIQPHFLRISKDSRVLKKAWWKRGWHSFREIHDFKFDLTLREKLFENKIKIKIKLATQTLGKGSALSLSVTSCVTSLW